MDKENENNERNIRKFNIQRTCLKHILLAMTISGCYDYHVHGKRKCSCRLLSVYRLFIFTALLTLTGKSVSGFAYIQKSDYFGHAIVLGWSVCNVITFLLSMRMNHSVWGNQKHTFEFWDTSIAPQFKDLGIKFDQDSFRRKQIIVCFIAIFIVVILVLFCSLQLSGTLGGGNTAISTIPFKQTLLTSFLQAVLFVISSIQSIIPMFYMVTICHMLYLSYHAFNKYLETQMCEAACQLPNSSHNILHFYINLCKAVRDFDKDFKHMFGNFIFWHTGLSLFTLYVVLRTDMNSYGIIALISYIFWLLLSVGAVVTMTVAAAAVHEAVRRFLISPNKCTGIWV